MDRYELIAYIIRRFQSHAAIGNVGQKLTEAAYKASI